jgi:hypothetical protein
MNYADHLFKRRHFDRLITLNPNPRRASDNAMAITGCGALAFLPASGSQQINIGGLPYVILSEEGPAVCANR